MIVSIQVLIEISSLFQLADVGKIGPYILSCLLIVCAARHVLYRGTRLFFFGSILREWIDACALRLYRLFHLVIHSNCEKQPIGIAAEPGADVCPT
jgi:hypothetical protein